MSHSPDAFPGGVPKPGALVGQKYRVERLLGVGGMGVVLAATHVHLGERVALKLVRPAAGVDLEAFERLLREARIASRIRSEHVARVFDLGTSDDGMPYIAMEFLEGEDLMSRLESGGAMSVGPAVDFLFQAIEGVAEAHALGVVHRDLKPANLFFTLRSDGSPCIKVLDFGISKLAGDVRTFEAGAIAPWSSRPEAEPGFEAATTQPAPAAPNGTVRLAGGTAVRAHDLTRSRARVGSPRYMAPEQVRASRDVDVRADVWALGAILYELLAGFPPFDGDSFEAVMETVLTREPQPIEAVRAEVPSGVAQAIRRCLRKEREERFASVAELARALAAFAPRGEERASRVERILTHGRAGTSGAPPSASSRDAEEVRSLSGAAAEASRDARAPRKRRVVLALAAASLIAAAAVAVPRVVALRREHAAALRTPGTATVAIVPPRNTGSREGDWIATELAELVAGDLAMSDKIRPLAADRLARAERDLGPELAAPLTRDAAAHLRTATGADYALTGTFARGEGRASDAVRIELALIATKDGRVLARTTREGSTGALFDLVTDVADTVRAELGVPDATPAERAAARASLPSDPEAARYYAEGIVERRARLPAKAREALARAVAAEPDHPLPHAELAAALTALGHDEEAREEAKRALDLSGSLPRERQLLIQERYWVATKDWARAADTLRTLHGFFPEELGYGLEYARTTMAAGNPREGLAILETLRDRASPNADSPEIDLMEAVLALKVSDFHRAIDAAERAARKGEASGARSILADAAMHEGDAYKFLGEPARSAEQCTKASALFLELHDESRRAGALVCEAQAYRALHQEERATQLSEEGLLESRRSGDSYLLANTLNWDGIRLYEEGNRPAARARWEEAAKIYLEIHDREGTGHTTGNIATVLFDEGDLPHARERFQAGLALHREVAAVAGQRNELQGLADIDAASGSFDDAQREYAEAETLGAQIDNVVELALLWVARARLLRDRGDADGARALAERARTVLHDRGAHEGAAEAGGLLAQLALDAHARTEGETQGRAALAEAEATSRSAQKAPVLALLARAAADAGQKSDAIRLADEAMAALGPSPTVITSLRTAIDAEYARGRAGSMRREGDAGATSPRRALEELAQRATTLGFRGCALEARLASATLGFGDAAAVARDARAAGYFGIAKRIR